MILHNAAGIAMVLLALAAAQGRGGDVAGTMGQGGAGTMAAPHAASVTPSTSDQSGDAARQGAAIDAMSSMHMADGMAGHSAMSAHMAWSDTRPATDADRERAREIVKTLQAALAKYKDYHVAETDGFKPFHPELRQDIYHFTRWQNGLKAAFTFDPAEPTSLLYRKTSDGGYELVGAMYTAPRRFDEDQLDERVPLSIAAWHEHVNICLPPKSAYATSDWKKFGFRGTIATASECEASGGIFHPVIFNWMVHVYPFEQDPAKVWAH